MHDEYGDGLNPLKSENWSVTVFLWIFVASSYIDSFQLGEMPTKILWRLHYRLDYTVEIWR